MQISNVKTAYVLTRAFVVVMFIWGALLTSHPAEARKNYLPEVTSLFPGTNLSKTCSNCHADWNGRETRNNAGVAYYLFQSGTAVTLTNAFFQNDADGDGISTGTEYTNSKSIIRPALPAKWLPNYADVDGDGCIQLYSRSDENGMPIAAAGISANGYLGASKGFIRYAPQGWDIDDNDATQGCSTAWPATSTPGSFVTPGVTADDTPPARISDLRGIALASAAIPLAWAAVGDDGLTGKAHSYDLRYTTAALASAKLTCGTGSSSCNVRDPAHWNQMYDMADSDVDGTAGKYLSKANGTLSTRSGTWNSGVVSPLMRALYEPIPSTPGSTQACTTIQFPSCIAPGASYALTSKGSSVLTNTIVNGATYWLAIRASDGVLKPTHVENPTGFTENVSPVSNIIAVTAGAAGAAITTISTATISASTPTSVTVTGPGLNSIQAAQMVLANTGGVVVASAAGLTYGVATVTGTFPSGITPGSYTLELRSAAGVTKAAWVNAILVVFPPPPQPPVLTSVTPNSLGQGATGQALTLTGYGFVSPMFTSFSDHNIAGAVVVTSDTTATATIETVGATAAPGLVSVATWGGTSNPLTFTVTPAPILVCSPPNGTAGVSYNHICTISGGIPPYTCYATGLPSGLSIATVGNTCVISGMPNVAGAFVGSVTVVDSNFGTTSIGVLITIAAPPTVICSPPAGTVGVAYSHACTATGGTPPYVWTATNLPPGLTMFTSGLISGIPTVAGTFTVNLCVIDSMASSSCMVLPIIISPPPLVPVITSPNTVTCTLYMPCSYQITATGNPVSFGAGNPTGILPAIGLPGLPPGLWVNTATGLISGIPTTLGLGLYWVGVSATNATGTGGKNISFTINSALTF